MKCSGPLVPKQLYQVWIVDAPLPCGTSTGFAVLAIAMIVHTDVAKTVVMFAKPARSIPSSVVAEHVKHISIRFDQRPNEPITGHNAREIERLLFGATSGGTHPWHPRLEPAQDACPPAGHIDSGHGAGRGAGVQLHSSLGSAASRRRYCSQSQHETPFGRSWQHLQDVSDVLANATIYACLIGQLSCCESTMPLEQSKLSAPHQCGHLP